MEKLSSSDRKAIIAQAKRRAHHLWETREAEGKISLSRNRDEDEQQSMPESARMPFGGEGASKQSPTIGQPSVSARTASRKLTAAEQEDFRAVHWGLIGAALVDSQTLTSEIPKSIVARFNAAAREEASPRVYEWAQLRKAFGSELLDKVRNDLSFGMQIRVASKYFNLPFLAAADIVYEMPNTDRAQIKAALSELRSGKQEEAVRQHGVVASKLASILKRFKHPESRRIAIDQSAAEYWKEYYGPFGTEMVAEIKKRVRADLAASWLRKNGVDQAAADYWAKYYGEFGENWVNFVPKKISPAK